MRKAIKLLLTLCFLYLALDKFGVIPDLSKEIDKIVERLSQSTLSNQSDVEQSDIVQVDVLLAEIPHPISSQVNEEQSNTPPTEVSPPDIITVDIVSIPLPTIGKDTNDTNVSTTDTEISDNQDLAEETNSKTETASEIETDFGIETDSETENGLFANTEPEQEDVETDTQELFPPDESISYRTFPYRNKIAYTKNTIELDYEPSNYIGGYLSYEYGEPHIYVNEYVPSESFKRTSEYRAIKSSLDFLNSPKSKKLTICHEYTHQLNNVFGLTNLSRKDQMLACKYDEIAASLSEILLAREMYLETGAENLFYGTLSFYYKGLSSRKITPQKGKISAKEASFIINQLVYHWCRDLEPYYAQQSASRYFYTRNTKSLSKEEFKKIITPFFSYEIDGQKINFLNYLQKELELTKVELVSLNNFG